MSIQTYPFKRANAMIRTVAFTLVILTSRFALAESELRLWIIQGKTVEASYIGTSGESSVFRTLDKTTWRFPKSSISEDDVRFIEAYKHRKSVEPFIGDLSVAQGSHHTVTRTAAARRTVRLKQLKAATRLALLAMEVHTAYCRTSSKKVTHKYVFIVTTNAFPGDFVLSGVPSRAQVLLESEPKC